jgi:hypothetical protein
MKAKSHHGMAAGALVACQVASILLVSSVTASSAETIMDCTNALFEQLRAARADFEQQMRACGGERQCIATVRSKQSAAMKRIDNETNACRTRVRATAPAERPPYAGWKPGDPPPVAKDGRRYIMACNGKVLGMYKPGGALAMDIESRPGKCMPVENWGNIGPARPPAPSTPSCSSWMGPRYEACMRGGSQTDYMRLPSY